jgi:hypothetical protein
MRVAQSILVVSPGFEREAERFEAGYRPFQLHDRDRNVIDAARYRLGGGNANRSRGQDERQA